jgi:hypothetical protein
MSFFDGLFSAITPGIGSIVGAGLGLVGNLVGGDKAQEGMDQASLLSAQTAQAQLDELKRGKAAGVAAIDQGTADYASTIAPLQQERPILLPTYRGLTTQQQMGQDDLLRSGQAMLASTGLRGAGRAGVGTVLNSMGRYNAAARDATDGANRAAKVGARSSADAATTGLATIKANAGTAKANTEIGAASQNAAVLGNQGQAQQQYAVGSGRLGGEALSSSAQLVGNAVQSIAGYNAGNSPNQPPLYPTYDPSYGPQRPREMEPV